MEGARARHQAARADLCAHGEWYTADHRRNAQPSAPRHAGSSATRVRLHAARPRTVGWQCARLRWEAACTDELIALPIAGWNRQHRATLSPFWRTAAAQVLRHMQQVVAAKASAGEPRASISTAAPCRLGVSPPWDSSQRSIRVVSERGLLEWAGAHRTVWEATEDAEATQCVHVTERNPWCYYCNMFPALHSYRGGTLGHDRFVARGTRTPAL